MRDKPYSRETRPVVVVDGKDQFPAAPRHVCLDLANYSFETSGVWLLYAGALQSDLGWSRGAVPFVRFASFRLKPLKDFVDTPVKHPT